MNGRHETGADIAAEIRAKCRSVDGINCGIADFLALADRIERAEAWLIHVEEKRRNALTQAWEPGSATAVVRMMLDAANDLRQANPAESDDLFYFADKLLETKAVAQGDAAKMREALVKSHSFLGMLIREDVLPGTLPPEASDLADDVWAAISAPPRNCDVGSPEEQAERFFAFCHAHRTFDTACSDECPFKTAPDINHCLCGWGQLPYTEEAK